MEFDNELGKTIIGTLIVDTPAACANVPLNAEIISINDFKLTDKASFCTYKMLKKENIEPVIRQNGIIRNYNLNKTPIFE